MPKKRLLVVVDMQNDFIDGALGTEEAREIVPKVKARIELAVGEGETVVYTRDTHEENYLNTQEGKNLPIPHCIRGTHGREIADGLYREGSPIFDKNAFGSPALAEYAEQNAFDSVELIGVCTDICVISNALLLKAFCPEAEISVRAGCCAGVTPESHAAALSAMKACQIRILA